MSVLIRGGLVLSDVDTQPTRADILVVGDRIAQINPSIPSPACGRVLNAADCLVIPGFVNAHTHAHNNLAKGAIDGLPLELWIHHLAARLLNRTPREVYVGAALGAIEMAKTGTTCACEMVQLLPWPTEEHLDAAVQAYVDVGLRATVTVQTSDLPFYEAFSGLEGCLPETVVRQVQTRSPYPLDAVLEASRRAAERWHGAHNRRIQFGLGPSILTQSSPQLLESFAQLANERQLPIQTHLAETKAQAYTAQARYGVSFTKRLHELGFLGPRTLLAHGIWLDAADIDLVAATGSSIAHNPISNLKLGAGIAPVLDMLERGCNVALGTDGSASSDNQNLFGPLRLAAILHRVVDPNYDRWMSARDVFRMATVNGARAAGFEGQVGSIEVGAKADLVLLDLRSSYYHPRNDLVTQVVHCETGSSVSSVLVDGHVIVSDGNVAGVDEPALLSEADEIGERIAAQVGIDDFARQIQPYVRDAHRKIAGEAWPNNRYASDMYRRLSTQGSSQ